MKKIIFVIILIAVAGLLVLFFKSRMTRRPENVPVENKSTFSPAQIQAQEKSKQLVQDLKSAAASDKDLDGLSDADEAKYGTSPTSSDTDGDGLLDKDEIFIYHTNPLKADTDGDGYKDGYEVRHGYNPNGKGKI